MSTITIGVDLAKSVFSVCEVEASGRVIRRQDLVREAFALWLAQLPVDTIVAMEACSGAHHWARRCIEHGLQPRLMAAQFVTPFRKSRTAKNDRNDAEAIATAARQGNMRFVPVKTAEQQTRLAWHRVREGYKVESLAIGNRLRGLLAEFGLVVAKSELALRRMLADLDRHMMLSPTALLEPPMIGLMEPAARPKNGSRTGCSFRAFSGSSQALISAHQERAVASGN